MRWRIPRASAWPALLLLALAACVSEQRTQVETPPPSYPGLKVEMVGVVLDQHGTPVGRCPVEVKDHEGRVVYSTVTASNGRYAIPWIPMGGALSVVVAPGGCGAVVRRYGSPDEFVRTPPVEVRVRCGSR